MPARAGDWGRDGGRRQASRDGSGRPPRSGGGSSMATKEWISPSHDGGQGHCQVEANLPLRGQLGRDEGDMS
jgi:hypothetical protein